MRRLLILHDSADFGGHERMLLALLPELLARGHFDDVLFCYPESNVRLREALALFAPRLRTREWRFTKRRAEPYLRFLRLGYQRAVRRLVARERPSVVLLVQGRIENLATALTALPRRVPVASYVPMAHRMAEMGRTGGLADRVRRALYRRPDAFIVPSASVATQLSAAGATAPVTVAPNVVAPPPATDIAAAREAIGVAGDARVALFLGRLDVAQKGLDLLVAAIDRAGSGGWTNLIVGDGPGRDMIRAAAARHPARIRYERWTERPDLYFSAADAVLMPSRYEGLPLVLLEALHFRVPVLASRIDVAAELLPPGNLVDFATVDLDRALDEVTSPRARETFARRAEAVLAAQTLPVSQQRFAEAVEKLA